MLDFHLPLIKTKQHSSLAARFFPPKIPHIKCKKESTKNCDRWREKIKLCISNFWQNAKCVEFGFVVWLQKQCKRRMIKCSTTVNCTWAIKSVFRCTLPFVAILVNKELWNHPRCWSVPSTYKSAGKLSPLLFANTAAQEEPKLDHELLVSLVSRCFIKWNYRLQFQWKKHQKLNNYVSVLLVNEYGQISNKVMTDKTAGLSDARDVVWKRMHLIQSMCSLQ